MQRMSLRRGENSMTAQIRRRTFIGAAAGATALAALPSGASAQSLPVARLQGPIPSGADNQPYRGANEQPVAGPGLPIPDLIPYGYIEEEYFVSGTVDGQPYRTTMLVRKPKDRSKFSGLVAVETIHAAGAIPMWGQKQTWMSGGHGWVGVASQLSTFNSFIKKHHPSRYSTLVLPEVGAAPGPGMSIAGGPQDMISQEIMTQVGRLLKANQPRGPFRGMRVRKLVLGGASQTGGTTLRYIQQSHGKAKLANGQSIYDAYFPMMAFSSTPLPEIDALIVHPVAEGDLVNSLLGNRQIGYRPDSDGPSRYRHYQVTGMSHVTTRGVTDPLQVFSTLANGVRPGEQLSQYPGAEVFRGIAENLVLWLMKGTPPPRAELIEVANGQIVRDVYGNARGGVRSPYVNQPTVKYIAAAPTAEGENPFRRLIGLEEPIPPEHLRAMYGSRAAYLDRFNREIDNMVGGRWLLPADAATLKAEEAKRSLF
jgi:hypothetical protein